MVFWRGTEAGVAPVTVPPEHEVAFDFPHTHGRLRHGTFDRAAHKISLQLDGWRIVQPPATVDRVGLLSFVMEPETESAKGMPGDLLPVEESLRQAARLVVEVRVADGIKIIEVRSALTVCNSTTVPMDMRLELRGRSVPLDLPPVLPKVVVHAFMRHILTMAIYFTGNGNNSGVPYGVCAEVSPDWIWVPMEHNGR
jgi:hypothetical protein